MDKAGKWSRPLADAYEDAFSGSRLFFQGLYFQKMRDLGMASPAKEHRRTKMDFTTLHSTTISESIVLKLQLQYFSDSHMTAKLGSQRGSSLQANKLRYPVIRGYRPRRRRASRLVLMTILRLAAKLLGGYHDRPIVPSILPAPSLNADPMHTCPPSKSWPSLVRVKLARS